MRAKDHALSACQRRMRMLGMVAIGGGEASMETAVGRATVTARAQTHINHFGEPVKRHYLRWTLNGNRIAQAALLARLVVEERRNG